jgi:ribosomal protein S27E
MSNKSIHIKTEIVNGKCPHCVQDTILISLTSDIFRCTLCENAIEQKINGKISYIPIATSKNPPVLKISDGET